MCKRPDIRCGNTHQPRFRLSPWILLGGRIQNEVFLDRHSNGFSLILANGVEVNYAQAAIRIPMRGRACCPFASTRKQNSHSHLLLRYLLVFEKNSTCDCYLALGSWIAIFEHMRITLGPSLVSQYVVEFRSSRRHLLRRHQSTSTFLEALTLPILCEFIKSILFEVRLRGDKIVVTIQNSDFFPRIRRRQTLSPLNIFSLKELGR